VKCTTLRHLPHICTDVQPCSPGTQETHGTDLAALLLLIDAGLRDQSGLCIAPLGRHTRFPRPKTKTDISPPHTPPCKQLCTRSCSNKHTHTQNRQRCQDDTHLRTICFFFLMLHSTVANWENSHTHTGWISQLANVLGATIMRVAIAGRVEVMWSSHVGNPLVDGRGGRGAHADPLNG
jgi:hypothetical protein